jgi:uroporphyrinogen-III synthase
VSSHVHRRPGEPGWAPLTGFRVQVTSAHRADELPVLLRRRGATVTSAAAIEMAPVRVAGHLLQIRGTCVLLDGAVKSLSPAAMATLRVLARRPGTVVSRTELLNALPGQGTDTHAVETAVLRLRTALGDKNIVATVVKRGYRLALDDEADGR